MMKQLATRVKALTIALLAVPLLLGGVIVALGNGSVLAAPGSPGVPEAPVAIFSEGFENNHSSSPIPLLSYTGDDSMSYTANVAWRSNCNGEVLFFNMADNQFANTNCDGGDGTNTTGAYDSVRRLAYALGTLHGGSSPSTNRALTAYTDNGASYVDPGAGLVQFETVDRIDLGSGNRRFIISNIDVAAINCTNPGTVQGQLRFFLLDDTSQRQINDSLINICTHSNATTVTPPTLQSNGAIGPNSGTIRVGSVITDHALLSNTNLVGIRMINAQGGGQGNDNALDNIQLADASPKLDKAFDPDTVEVGGTSRMTFTVTNTTDLLAKEGWSFTDALPENLKVATDPESETNCPNGQITATPGATSVSYAGDLDQNMVSCTLSINVTSDVAGTYVNGPDNLSEVVGLHLPADADVTFVPKAPDTGSARSIPYSVYLGTGLLAAAGSYALYKKQAVAKVRKK